MFRPTKAIIDMKRIRANTALLKDMVGNGFFCPMVKANAYGHGDVEVARSLADAGIERFGVVMVEEGLRLREAGIETEVLVFTRLNEAAARALLDAELTPVLSSWEDLKLLASLAIDGPIRLHIKIDTGMRRMGFDLEDVPELRTYLAGEKRLQCVGLCTHLSHGSDAAQPEGVTEQQIEKFETAYRALGNERLARHVLNSDALIARADAGMDSSSLGARPGLAIYGLCGGLSPAMSLVSQLDLVRRVSSGDSVSYGGRWTASKDSWIGIVPVGYGDGYWRSFSNRSQMLFRERRVPVVGSVCMDYSLLDLTDACADGVPKAGEEIVVFGEKLTVRELTELAGTIPYELVTGLSNRVPRVYT